MTPAPSNLRRPTVVARDGRGVPYRFIVEPERPLPVRVDPGYDDPWQELRSPLFWIAAIVCAIGFIAGLALLIAVAA